MLKTAAWPWHPHSEMDSPALASAASRNKNGEKRTCNKVNGQIKNSVVENKIERFLRLPVPIFFVVCLPIFTGV